MKKLISILLILILILSACQSGNIDGSDKEGKEVKTIYTSMYPVYQMVKYIGGDRLDIKNLMENNPNAHSYEPKANDIIEMSKADLLFINGLGMESWLSDTKSSIGDVEIVDLSDGLDLIKLDEGHNHGGEYDPHIWLSLDNLEDQLEIIYEKLRDLSPGDGEYFKNNLDSTLREIEKIEGEYEDRFEKYEGKYIVVPHEAFSYLVNELDIYQVPVEGINSDSEPGSGRLKEIVDFARDKDITTIFYEMGGSKDVAQTIANEINGRIEEISSLETEDENGRDFFEIYRMNLDNILESFK